MRISDWSSDVCSSDLSEELRRRVEQCTPGMAVTSTLCVAAALFGMDEEDALAEVLQVFEALQFDLEAARVFPTIPFRRGRRSEEHTSELQSLMRISYAVLCLKEKKHNNGSRLHRYYEKPSQQQKQ